MPDNRTCEDTLERNEIGFYQTAATTVSQAIGVDLFTKEPLPDPNEGKASSDRTGQAWRLKGGKARPRSCVRTRPDLFPDDSEKRRGTRVPEFPSSAS
jgi:hypothetical protein